MPRLDGARAVPTPRLESIEEEVRRFRRAEEAERRRQERRRRELRPPLPPVPATMAPHEREVFEPPTPTTSDVRARIQTGRRRFREIEAGLETPGQRQFRRAIGELEALAVTERGAEQKRERLLQLRRTYETMRRTEPGLTVPEFGRRVVAGGVGAGVISPEAAEEMPRFAEPGVPAVQARTMARGPIPVELPRPGEGMVTPTVMPEPALLPGPVERGLGWAAEQAKRPAEWWLGRARERWDQPPFGIPEQGMEAFYTATMFGPGLGGGPKVVEPAAKALLKMPKPVGRGIEPITRVTAMGRAAEPAPGAAGLWTPTVRAAAPAAERVGPAARRLPPEFGQLQRWEARGVVPDPTKPHGLYLSPGGVKSPHVEPGWVRHNYVATPKNPLDVSGVPPTPIRPGAIDSGAGVRAIRKLDEALFQRLQGLSGKKLADEVRRVFPELDVGDYYDKQEVLEAVGAALARSRGYDAIIDVDLVAPAFSEFVALTSGAIRDVAARGAERAPGLGARILEKIPKPGMRPKPAVTPAVEAPVEGARILTPGEAAVTPLNIEELTSLRSLRGLREAKKLTPAARLVLEGLERRAISARVDVPEEVMGPVIGRLQEGLKAVGELQAEYKTLKHTELSKRFGAIEGVFQSTKYPETEKRKIALGLLRGWGPERPIGEIPGLQMGDVDLLLRAIHTDVRFAPGTRLNASTALNDFLGYMAGVTNKFPTEGEARLLGKFFGPEFARTVEGMRPWDEKLRRAVGEVLNIPRALMASYDLSAPLRQGVMLAPGHPVEFLKAHGPMFKAVFSGKYAQALEETILADPMYAISQMARNPTNRLYIAEIGGGLVRGEEVFMANWATKIPVIGKGVEVSERAYVTFLNKLRLDVFKTTVQTWQRRGVPYAQKDIDDLSRFINFATGRGTLGPLNQVAPFVGAPFFAPRFALSRFEVWTTLVSSDRLVRNMAVRDLGLFVGSGVALLSLAKLSGAVEVEMDPRSTDFAKIRRGPLRMDFWGGNLPVVRQIAQFIMGERKTTGPDPEIYDANQMITAGRFVQGKLSPWAGFLVDVARGETFLGEEMHPDAPTVRSQLFNRLVPMFMQDLVNAVQEMGPMGALWALPGAAGVTITAYKTAGQRMADARDVASRDLYGISFDELQEKGAKGVKPGYRSAVMAVESHEAIIRAVADMEKERARYSGFPSVINTLARYKEAQEEADEKFPNPREWRDDERYRQTLKTGALADFYANNPEQAERQERRQAEMLKDIPDVFDLPPDVDADTLAAAWFSVFGMHTDPRTGEAVDRDRLYDDLDRFQAQLTAEQQATLDAQMGISSTERQREAQEDNRRLDRKWAWFERYPRAWASVFEGAPPLEYYTTFTPEGERVPGHAERLREMMEAGPFTETEAYAELAKNYPQYADQLEAFRKAKNSQKAETNPFLRARLENPELDYFLYKRGDTDTVLSTEAWMLWWDNYGRDLAAQGIIVKPRFHDSVKDELKKLPGPWRRDWAGE